MAFKKNWKKYLSVVIIVAVGFLGMTMLSSTEKHSNKRDLKPEVRAVETETLQFSDMVLEIEGNGVIESQQTLNIVSEATGKVLYAKNNLKDGTFVEKGETILKIDSREVENDLYSLRSAFLNSLASILPDIKIENPDAYKKWFNYFSSIDIHKTLPEMPEVEASFEKIKLSTRDIFTKYYAVKNQEILLSKHNLTAPFTGYIKSNGVLENSYVTRGQHLFTLSDATHLEIAVPLLVEEINMIDFSGTPKVKISPDNNGGEKITGYITRKETNLDRNSQTLNVYVTFTNYKLNSHFLPGNYVNLKIHGKQLTEVATVPRHLVDNENKIFTMEEGKLAKQKVDLVAIQGNRAIINNNLPEKTRIVKTVLQKPLIGMEIQSINELENEKEVADTKKEEKEIKG